MSSISIIVPTYNVEKYIARALDSCIHQSFKDIQIIIVDDCGKDRSIDIAKQYASRDKRIKIIHNDRNLGTFASRNVGVAHANSPYVMFLDPDDYYDLSACELAFKNIKNHDVLQFNIKNLNDYTKNFTIARNFTNFYQNISMLNFMSWNCVTLLIRREFYLKRVQFHRRKLCFGEDLLVFSSLITSNMVFLDKMLYNYEQNENSITKSNKIKIQLRDQIFVYKQIQRLNLDKDIIFFYCFFLKQNIVFLLFKLGKMSFISYKLTKKYYKFIRKYYRSIRRYYKIRQKLRKFFIKS